MFLDPSLLRYTISDWTMAEEGSKRVEIAGKDDKRQLTAVFAGSMNGEFYPLN